MSTHLTAMPARRVRGMLAAVCVGAIGVAAVLTFAPDVHAAQTGPGVGLVSAYGTR